MDNTATNQVVSSTANNIDHKNLRVTVGEAVIINSRRIENIERQVLGDIAESSVSQTTLIEQMSELKNHTTKKTDMIISQYISRINKIYKTRLLIAQYDF